MAQDSTRRLLKVFGIAVTNLEDALEAALAEGAKKAEAEVRERMTEVIALVERLGQVRALLDNLTGDTPARGITAGRTRSA